jgi:TatD DNase family protein
MSIALIDTHTHFDVEVFDPDRMALAERASQQGVRALVLIGYLAQYFERLQKVQHGLNQQPNSPIALLAPGLHPFYIQQHHVDDLIQLDDFLTSHPCVAVGEIGLDTFTAEMKQPEVYKRQKDYFSQQLEISKNHNLPVMLHIRRAHADALAILKQHHFTNGGIAHAFGGGIEEAKAFIKLGFKLGINGLVTDPNAKRLRTVVQAVGAEHLVLETDCPDMMPLCCRVIGDTHRRNTPGNLSAVLDELSLLLGKEQHILAEKLWQNSSQCLGLDWEYGHARIS